MSLASLIDSRFGVRTRAVENPANVTAVGVAAVLLLSNNPNRLGFTVVNLSANVIYVGLAQDVSATKGVRLDANGGSVSVVWDKDFQMVGWAWWAIAAGAASAIYSLAVVEY